MSAAALAIGSAGAGILGSILSQNAADEKAKKQAQIMQAALAQAQPFIASGYDSAASALNPWVSQGLLAQQNLQGMLSGIDPNSFVSGMPNEFTYNMPTYDVNQFLDPSMAYEQDLARQSVEASAAARGGVLSGATLKEIQDRGQSIARQGYAQAYDRMLAQQQLARSDRSAAYQQYADRARLMADQASQRINAMQMKLSGLGSLAQSGSAASSNLANIMQNRGESMANLVMSGATNKANSVGTGWQGMLGGALGALGQAGSGFVPFAGTQVQSYGTDQYGNTTLNKVGNNAI